MGPDFVPSPPPDNELSLGQGSSLCHDQFLPNTNNNLSPTFPADENPSLLGMNETGYSIPCPTPESIYGMMTTSYATTCTPLDNASTNLPSSLLFNYNEIDNAQECVTGMDNRTADNVYVEDNDFSKVMVGPKAMANSTESVDTVSSSSSGDVFSSEYIDTVSSTTSSAFLIKPSATDSDEEIMTEEQNGLRSDPSCYNDGYMSCSSTEVLNDESDDNESQENLLPQKAEDEQQQQDSESEIKPMLLGNGVESTNDCSIEIGNSLADFYPHPLSPIKENEIVTFGITEVEPKQYTKITDNIIVVDESFLFNSNSNLGEMECHGNGKRAVTMQNLHERSSFLDLTEISKVGKACQKALVYLRDDITMGSLVSLNTAVAKENNKDPIQSLSLISGFSAGGVLEKSSNYTKNLLALSFTITLLYVAVGSVRNLQSSINHEGGVGVIGLAFNFVGYVLGSVFSSSIVQSFQPRKCLIANLFPNLLYIAANLYPVMWVMVPISFIQGISLAIIANACSTYITYLAKGCAQSTKDSFAEISCRFFGTYSLMYISHLIIGNLIASLILQPSSVSFQETNSSSNASMLGNITDTIINISSSVPNHLKKCGPNFCQHFEIGGGSQFTIGMGTKYTLFGVYFGCVILAILIAFVFMEPLNGNIFRSTVSPIRKLKHQMSSLMRFFADVKFILLLPMLMQSVMQFAFVTAEFAKGYITCALGMHMIGYTMICFGVCSCISSFTCGLLNKYIGRIPFIVAENVRLSLETPFCVLTTCDDDDDLGPRSIFGQPLEPVEFMTCEEEKHITSI